MSLLQRAFRNTTSFVTFHSRAFQHARVRAAAALAPAWRLATAARENVAIAAVLVFTTIAASAGVNGNAGPVRAWYYDSYGIYAGYGAPADLGRCMTVSVGGGHFAAIRDSDRVLVMWGRNDAGQTTVPPDLTEATDVSLGEAHSMALSKFGGVRTWGSNAYGQLQVPPGTGACIAIAAGAEHSLAIRANGSVRAWGLNDSGQIQVPSGMLPCTRIAAGRYHSVALQSNGVVRAWGALQTDCGQTGADGQTGAIGIAAGPRSTAVVRSGGSLGHWGCEDNCGFGLPYEQNGYQSVAFGEVIMGLTTDGRIQAYGPRREWWGGVYCSNQFTFPQGPGRWSAIAGYGNSYIGIQDDDCDNNGIADTKELDGHDCNGNGYLDACDAALGTIEDCNDNGYGDSCEKTLWVEIQSPTFTHVGYPGTFTWTIPAVAPAISPLYFEISAHGDFSSPLEYVRVRVGPEFRWDAFAPNGDYQSGSGSDCGESWDEPGYDNPLTASLFNSSISADGTATITFTPAIAVDANLCPDGTWLRAKLSYTSATSADCNANGLLDSCEIRNGWANDANGNGRPDSCEGLVLPCPSDVNNSGRTDGADLGMLLSYWGQSSPTTLDLDSNGIINGADLGLMLSGWGDCVH